jgi:hypothetical protein
MEQTASHLGKSVAKRGHAIAAATLVVLLSSTGGMAQFRATPDIDGNMIVVDTSGQIVEVAPGDPVGTRPTDCPGDAFYVSEVQNDKTELVLTDCATNQHQYTVEMQEQAD